MVYMLIFKSPPRPDLGKEESCAVLISRMPLVINDG